QRAVDLAAVVLAGDRLLPRVAALRERDVRRLEPRFGRQHAVVELPSPARHAGLDPAALELVAVDRGLEARVEELAGAGEVRREAALVAEDEYRRMLLGLDLAVEPKPHPDEQPADDLGELGLGQDEIVVLAAPQDDDGRDDARLRGEEQRRAGVPDL